MIASFQKKWETFHVPVRTEILSQFISERSNKKMSGRAGPELGGPLNQANEQLAMTCTARTGEWHRPCWVIRAWQTDTLTAYLDSARPLPAMGLQGPWQGTAFPKVETVPTPKCSKPSYNPDSEQPGRQQTCLGNFRGLSGGANRPKGSSNGTKWVAAIKYTENG